MQLNAIVLLCAIAPAMAMLRGTGDQTLTTNMQPEVVRKLLKNVELTWIHLRVTVALNVTSDEQAFAEMEKSCVKVASAILAGSEGQKDRVTEYMQDVCSIDDDKGLCAGFASGIEAAMTDDSEYNRDELKLSHFCQKFWEKTVTAAAQAEAKEQAEKAEKERLAKEEAEKKAAAEMAAAEEAEKKAEAEEAAKKAAEAAKKTAEDKVAAEEAAQAKAYEASEEAAKAKNQTNQTSPDLQAANVVLTNETSLASAATAAAPTNQTSAASQANGAAAPGESSLVNSTAPQASSNVEQSNASSTPPTPVSSTRGANPATAAEAPEKKTNSTFTTNSTATH